MYNSSIYPPMNATKSMNNETMSNNLKWMLLGVTSY